MPIIYEAIYTYYNLKKKEGNLAGMGTMGIWANSPCNHFVPSRPAQGQSHIYHFHLMMEC